jgi:hypothetical protein
MPLESLGCIVRRRPNALGQNPISLTRFDDVKALITDRAAYFAIGRIVRLQEARLEGPGACRSRY